MTFVYYKVQQPELVINGWFFFKTALFSFMEPVCAMISGQIVHEHWFDCDPKISVSDAACIAAMTVKKLPSDVAVYCKEYPSGGWTL